MSVVVLFFLLFVTTLTKLKNMEHFVTVRISPFECLALDYILNYYIKVTKIFTHKKQINKGTGDAFVQLSDPSDDGDVLPPRPLTYSCNLTFMSGSASLHSTNESGGLKLASYCFTYLSQFIHYSSMTLHLALGHQYV